MFKDVLNLKNTGPITLNPTNISVYLNDGKGTKEVSKTENFTINVLTQKTGHKPVNDLETLVSEDKTPPKSFQIVAGRDDSIFEGKRFLSFSTTDEQSGIKYYEVIEDNLPPIRSNGTYVLLNQDRSIKVIVLAYDAAGNVRKSTYGSTPYNLIYLVITILVLSTVAFVIYKKRRRRGL